MKLPAALQELGVYKVRGKRPRRPVRLPTAACVSAPPLAAHLLCPRSGKPDSGAQRGAPPRMAGAAPGAGEGCAAAWPRRWEGGRGFRLPAPVDAAAPGASAAPVG